MPEPFSSFLNFLAVFSLNISLECYTGQSFFQGVYLSAAAPFVLAMFLSFVSFAAKLGAGGGEKLASRLLLLSYVVLPPTVLKLFQVKNGGRSLFLFTCHCLLSAASRHSHFLLFFFLLPGAGLCQGRGGVVRARRHRNQLQWKQVRGL